MVFTEKMATAANEEVIDEALKQVCLKFGVSLKPYQEDFFRQFYKDYQKDFFIAQPTGSGKSLLFQALPIFVNCAGFAGNNDALVLVVSPLVALMKDQCKSLEKRQISACCLLEEFSEKVR